MARVAWCSHVATSCFRQRTDRGSAPWYPRYSQIRQAEWALYHLVRLDGYFADQLGLGMTVAVDDVDQWPDDLLQPVDVAPWLQDACGSCKDGR